MPGGNDKGSERRSDSYDQLRQPRVHFLRGAADVRSVAQQDVRARGRRVEFCLRCRTRLRVFAVGQNAQGQVNRTVAVGLIRRHESRDVRTEACEQPAGISRCDTAARRLDDPNAATFFR